MNEELTEQVNEEVPEEKTEEVPEENLSAEETFADKVKKVVNDTEDLVNSTVLLKKRNINKKNNKKNNNKKNNSNGSNFFSALFIVVLFIVIFVLGTNFNDVKTKFMNEYKTGLLNNFSNEHKKNDDYAAIVDY